MRAKNKYDTEWWIKVENDAFESIKRALKQVKEGKVIAHEDVMKKHKKWLKHITSLRY